MEKTRNGKVECGREQILLVDDDAVFREEFAQCFPGYGFVQAGSGREALAILGRPNGIDLAVIDVKMPGMDGLSLLEKIKQMAPEIGTIIVTGYTSKEVILKVLRGKADDYLEKPFDVEKTGAMIEKVLNAKKYGYSNSTADTAGKIEQVKKFLLRNASRKVSLKDAGGSVCLNPKYLSRLFREQTGTGFNQYKLRVKIGEAKALLEGAGSSVDQVSEKLGYQNPESFIRQFKKHTGQTPACYRKTCRARARR